MHALELKRWMTKPVLWRESLQWSKLGTGQTEKFASDWADWSNRHKLGRQVMKVTEHRISSLPDQQVERVERPFVIDRPVADKCPRQC